VELERVISEHDEAVHDGKGDEVTRVTVSVIHDIEARVADLQRTATEAGEALAEAKAGLCRLNQWNQC
jgi:hypothetical protein